MTSEVYLHCAVMCSSGTDFEDTPPLLYYCAGGEWNYWKGLLPRYKNSNPWPITVPVSLLLCLFVTPLCSSVAVNSTLHSVSQLFHTFKLRLSPTEIFFISLKEPFSWLNCSGNFLILVKMF